MNDLMAGALSCPVIQHRSAPTMVLEFASPNGPYNLRHVVPLQPELEGNPDRLRCGLMPRPIGRHPGHAPPW